MLWCICLTSNHWRNGVCEQCLNEICCDLRHWIPLLHVVWMIARQCITTQIWPLAGKKQLSAALVAIMNLIMQINQAIF